MNMEWKKARHKPTIVEYREIEGNRELIHTREGVLFAYKDDFVIKGVEGELYPIAKDIFYKTYEPLENE